MGKVNFTEEQIVAALRRVEGGTPVAEVCRKLGVTEQTYYRWKVRSGERREFPAIGRGGSEEHLQVTRLTRTRKPKGTRAWRESGDARRRVG